MPQSSSSECPSVETLSAPSASSDSTSRYIPSIPVARGIPWPPFTADWESRLDAMADFEPRDDDVFVISYPKSGHHWSHEFLTRIISGINDYPKGSKVQNFFEMNTLKSVEDVPSPRLILTHLPFEFLPKRLLEKRSKIIRISRNPKDVCVSFYHHWCAIDMYQYSEPFASFFDLFMEGLVDYGSYFEFERRYQVELGGEDRLDHIHHTSFETLKAHPHQTMKELGAFIGVDRSEEFYEEVVDKTSFDKVKAIRVAEQPKNIFKKGATLHRKGQVGDWINHLTVAQSRRMDALTKEYDIDAVYEL